MASAAHTVAAIVAARHATAVAQRSHDLPGSLTTPKQGAFQMSRSDLLRNLPGVDEAYISAFEAVYPPDEAGPRNDEAGRERILALHREDAKLARRLLEVTAHRVDPGNARAVRVINAALSDIEAMERRIDAATTVRYAATVADVLQRARTR